MSSTGDSVRYQSCCIGEKFTASTGGSSASHHHPTKRLRDRPTPHRAQDPVGAAHAVAPQGAYSTTCTEDEAAFYESEARSRLISESRAIVIWILDLATFRSRSRLSLCLSWRYRRPAHRPRACGLVVAPGCPAHLRLRRCAPLQAEVKGHQIGHQLAGNDP
jgi:hypothetical protein